MAKHLKDHWYIAIALIAIFLAGNGSGYVFGTKTSCSQTQPSQVAVADWSEITLERLGRSLELTPEQIDAVRAQVETTAGKVVAARERTLLDYHVLLLNLHDELGQGLTPSQQAKLKESRAALERAIKSRFSALLDRENQGKLPTAP